MNTNEATSSTAININDTTAGAKERAINPPKASFFSIFKKKKIERGGWKRGLAIFDSLLRICAFAATLAAAIVMATSDETLPFFTGQYQFYANFSDLPSLPFFVIGNAIVAGYLVLSFPFSIAAICCPHLVGLRFLLLIFDLIMVVLTTAAASAATAIVELAHTGNSNTNWVAICLRFDGFCQEISGAVVASFIGLFFLVVLVLMSALSLRKH